MAKGGCDKEKKEAHGEKMEPENVVNSESLQLENDRSQVASLHLWNRRLFQFLIRLLYT